MFIFKFFGGLALSLGAFLLILVLGNVFRLAKPGGHDITPLVGPALLFLLLGVGLVLHHRWAAVAFAAITAGCGIWLFFSIGTVPMPWVLINIAYGLVFLAPAVLTIRHWSQLGPSGRADHRVVNHPR